jgi:acetylornithine deacetylase ArgE
MDTLEILKQLVAIPSVNPMCADSGKAAEREITDYIEGLLRREGIDCERQSVVDGRENLIAFISGSTADHKSRSGGLLLSSHMDTVPVDSMTIPPFEPAVRDGKLYGRGSCDAKGPLAAMLTAFLNHAGRPRRKRPVALLATVDEEFSFSGSRRFISRSWPIAAAVVGEPTQLTNVIAHKGVVRWRLEVRGISAHGATPALGRSAIYDGARIALLLEEYADELQQQQKHPLLGGPTLNVGRVSGGQAVNMVPDRCVFEIDRRLLPGETGLEALRECEQWLQHRLGNHLEFRLGNPFLADPALETHETAHVLEAVRQAEEFVLGSSTPCLGAHYSTDGSKLAAVGIETIVCGPGDLAQMHTNAEYIELEQVEHAVRLYDHLLENWGADV